jgi:hypothetical protein
MPSNVSVTVDVLVSDVVRKAVENWDHNLRRIENCRSNLEDAQRAARADEKDLGALLVPKGAKPGQTFNIWILRSLKQEALLHIEVGEISSSQGMVPEYHVSWWKPA